MVLRRRSNSTGQIKNNNKLSREGFLVFSLLIIGLNGEKYGL